MIRKITYKLTITMSDLTLDIDKRFDRLEAKLMR